MQLLLISVRHAAQAVDAPAQAHSLSLRRSDSFTDLAMRHHSENGPTSSTSSNDASSSHSVSTITPQKTTSTSSTTSRTRESDLLIDFDR